MKLALVLLSIAAFAAAELAIPEYNTAYDYLEKIGVPEAKRIKEQEEKYMKNPLSRIFNGSGASAGQFPFQVYTLEYYTKSKLMWKIKNNNIFFLYYMLCNILSSYFL